MRHYVLPEDYDGSGSLVITGEENHYLTRVLKKRSGDRFAGLDPHGNQVSILLTSAVSEQCTLQISKETLQNKAKTEKTQLDIILFQCIPKARKMDTIVRQAVEAGVTQIIPVQSENTVVRLDDESGEKKRERWRRIARQAMQQSGSKRAAEIEEPISILDVPKMWGDVSSPADIPLFFHEKRLSEMTLHVLLARPAGKVGVCIGPEGGFSPDEAADLLQSGFQPVYINTNVLRTETAALYAVAAVQTVILENDSWTVR